MNGFCMFNIFVLDCGDYLYYELKDYVVPH